MIEEVDQGSAVRLPRGADQQISTGRRGEGEEIDRRDKVHASQQDVSEKGQRNTEDDAHDIGREEDRPCNI